MSVELENRAKKYEEFTNNDETIKAMANIILALLCLTWKVQK